MADLIQAPEIRLEGLTVGYGGRAVVSDIDLVLPAGQISVILGGSGSGKSTLLRHILRLNPPIAGRILIGGHDLSTMRGKAFSCLRQNMGVLFQDGALLGSMTLGENVALPLREHTNLKDREVRGVVSEKLRLVGLDGFEDYYPNELSGGMRKRAGLARALVMDPGILFCDEPTSGLDPILSAELDQLLLAVKRQFGGSMVVVSHDLASMRAIADHVVVLGAGRTLFAGTPGELENTTDEYLRRFLDRSAKAEGEERAAMKRLDPSRRKIDCSRYLGEPERKDN